MSYTQEQAMNFWFKFDDQLKGSYHPTPEVNEAYRKAFSQKRALMNSIVDLARDFSGAELAGKFNTLEREGLLKLAEVQLRIIREFFPDFSDLQLAFEDFGQGVLLDTADRGRDEGDLIHMMDGNFDELSCVGYHRWYAFIKVFRALGVTDDADWKRIAQFVSLAWAIQSELNPPIDVKNQPMERTRLQELRDEWLPKSESDLDAAYFSYEGKFPQDVKSTRAPGVRPSVSLTQAASDDLATSSAPAAALAAPESRGVMALAAVTLQPTDVITFAMVRELLEKAVGNGHPAHTGKGRFWNKPLSELLTMKVHGKRVIAAPGEDRGKNSALVQSLRGTLASTPRMPLYRPPMPEEDIDKIERWIDAGCPEGAPASRLGM